MKGLTREAVRDKFTSLKDKLEKQGYTVIDSVIENSPGVKSTSLWCIGKSIQLMSDCDVIYFAKGFNKARGCRIEYKVARDYGIPMMFEEDLLEFDNHAS